MVVAICFDRNFQKWATVTLYSLYKHHKRHPKVRLFVLTDLKYDECIFQLKRMLRKFDYTLINPGSDFDHMPTGFHYSIATYWRLVLPNILNDLGVSKCLYLDADLLILGNCNDLYNTDISNYYCAGIRDYCSESESIRLGLINRFYINAGVILMDVSKMSSINWVARSVELAKSGIIKLVDQDIINVLLNEKILELNMKWNIQTGDVKKSNISTPVIIHFTGDVKPWLKKSSSPYVGYYRREMFASLFLFDFLRLEIPRYVKILRKSISKYF